MFLQETCILYCGYSFWKVSKKDEGIYNSVHLVLVHKAAIGEILTQLQRGSRLFGSRGTIVSAAQRAERVLSFCVVCSHHKDVASLRVAR